MAQDEWRVKTAWLACYQRLVQDWLTRKRAAQGHCLTKDGDGRWAMGDGTMGGGRWRRDSWWMRRKSRCDCGSGWRLIGSWGRPNSSREIRVALHLDAKVTESPWRYDLCPSLIVTQSSRAYIVDRFLSLVSPDPASFSRQQPN